MKTAKTKPAAIEAASQARFLEIRAGRLSDKKPPEGYSQRLALARPFTAPPTD